MSFKKPTPAKPIEKVTDLIVKPSTKDKGTNISPEPFKIQFKNIYSELSTKPIQPGTYQPIQNYEWISQGNSEGYSSLVSQLQQAIFPLKSEFEILKAEFLEFKKSLGVCGLCNNLSSPGDYLCPACAKKEST